jgi:hypothetical protein
VAASVCEYDAPATAEGRVDGVVIARVPSVMASEKVWLAVWRAASVTLMVKVETPGVAGTPEITPDGLSESRGGKVPELICHT